MKTLENYILNVKDKLECQNISQTFKALKMNRQAWHQITKGGGISDKNCIKIAEILKINPLEVISSSKNIQSKTKEERNIWAKLHNEKYGNISIDIVYNNKKDEFDCLSKRIVNEYSLKKDGEIIHLGFADFKEFPGKIESSIIDDLAKQEIVDFYKKISINMNYEDKENMFMYADEIQILRLFGINTNKPEEIKKILLKDNKIFYLPEFIWINGVLAPLDIVWDKYIPHWDNNDDFYPPPIRVLTKCLINEQDAKATLKNTLKKVKKDPNLLKTLKA